jgi:RNA polymerase sigma factor (sigma-70 family)
MLDIDTIHNLYDLTADTLYSAEIAQLPRLSRAEGKALVSRIQQGDSAAREVLITSCLAYALGVARFTYHTRRPQHDDLLDLAQVASERMLERLDKALSTSAPEAYLRGVARRAIMDYCTYHADLIQKPEYALVVLQKMNPHPAIVVSLDAPIGDDEDQIIVDLIQAPAPRPEPDEQQERKHYTVLYQAIHRLSKEHQATLVRLYGLFGQPAETAEEIGRPELIRNRAYEARKKLRSTLVDHLHQLTSPIEEGKED